jgi:hypothetical protein
VISRPIAHLGWVVLLASCAAVPMTPVSPPAALLIDVSPFRRIWIAGFVTSANRDIDVNLETVRLLRRRLNPRTPLRVIDAEPLTIRDESELSDRERWKRLAEEYAEPLIVTGSVRLNAARPVALERTTGRGSVYLSRKGFVLETTFVFIDGRSGEVIASDHLPKETLYGSDARTSTLFLYFQLMDRVLPRFFRALGQ